MKTHTLTAPAPAAPRFDVVHAAPMARSLTAYVREIATGQTWCEVVATSPAQAEARAAVLASALNGEAQRANDHDAAGWERQARRAWQERDEARALAASGGVALNSALGERNEARAALLAASLVIRDLSKQLADLGVTPRNGWEAFRAARAAAGAHELTNAKSAGKVALVNRTR